MLKRIYVTIVTYHTGHYKINQENIKILLRIKLVLTSEGENQFGQHPF